MTTDRSPHRTSNEAADQTDAATFEETPTPGQGLSVVWAIVRANVKQAYHNRTATRRKRILVLVGTVAFLPVIGLLLLGAYAAGETAAMANSTALRDLARWMLPVILVMIAAHGALLITDQLLEFGAQRLLLSIVANRTLALALLCNTVVQIVLTLGGPLTVLFAAYGIGAGSPLAGVVGCLITLGFILAGLLVGVVCGLLGRLALYHVAISADSRELYGTVMKLGFFIVLGAGGAIAGATLGRSEVETSGLTAIAPTGAPPLPLGYAADWLFIGTPLLDSLGLTALLSGVFILTLIPASIGAIVRVTPSLWYTDPTRPDEITTVDTRPSFLQGGRFHLAGRLAVVVEGLLRRARRQPQRFAFLAYHLFFLTSVGVSLLVNSQVPVVIVSAGGLLIFGLWVAGAGFCLNPLGEEGAMLSQLILSSTSSRTIIRARVVAGTLIATPLVIAGSVLLGMSVLSLFQTAVLAAYWLGLVPVSAGLALGVGTLLPATESRELLDTIEMRAPELLAIIYHGVLMLLFVVAGTWIIAGVSDVAAQIAGAITLAVAAFVTGHGGYRFAVSAMADYRRSHRIDRVFTVELGVGMALAGLVLSQSALLGTTLLVDLGGFTAFVSQFLAQYAGWAAIILAYLFLTNRTDYLDVGQPTRSDVHLVGAVTTGLLVLWAAVSVGVRTFELPFAERALGGVASGTGELAAIVVLFLLVNAPVEEVLFRNIIQKRLSEALSSRIAIVIATLVFGVVHLPAYLTSGPIPAIIPVALITVAGGGFAFVYDRTGNILPAVLCHGLYNAIQVIVVFLIT